MVTCLLCKTSSNTKPRRPCCEPATKKHADEIVAIEAKYADIDTQKTYDATTIRTMRKRDKLTYDYNDLVVVLKNRLRTDLLALRAQRWYGQATGGGSGQRSTQVCIFHHERAPRPIVHDNKGLSSEVGVYSRSAVWNRGLGHVVSPKESASTDDAATPSSAQQTGSASPSAE